MDNKNHYTTAHDLALITAAAMKNPAFVELASTYEHRISGIEYARMLQNKNQLLQTLDGCIGVKTGFTKKTGRCFVGAREIDGQKIVCVVLNCGDWFGEAARLLKEAQATYANKYLLTAEQIFTATDGTQAVATETFRYPLTEAELAAVKVTIADDTVAINFADNLLHQSHCTEIEV